MSTTVEPPPARPAVTCPRCGAAVPPERDWCLECGEAARTRILPARGWKVPIAIVLGVLLLAGVAVVVAFVSLSSDAGDAARLAQAPPVPAPVTLGTAPVTSPPAATTTPTAPGPTTSTTPAPAPAGTVGTWPAGRTAYTVVLSSSTAPAAARATARKALGLGHGAPVGTLRSDDYPSLSPGSVVVFSGQYARRAGAERAIRGWDARGWRGAYATLVRAR